MKNRLKFKFAYLLFLIFLATIAFYILNPTNLLNNKEYFNYDFNRFDNILFYSFLPENPFYDVVYLNTDGKVINFFYRNLDTEAIRQIEFPDYSINWELSVGSNSFYYDKEERTMQVIFTSKNAYYLYEVYNPDNKFEVKGHKFFNYDLYDELQANWLKIKQTKFFPSKFDDQNGKNCIIKKFEDGYKILFNIETLQKLRKVPITAIENDELYFSICDKMKNSIGIEYTPADIFEIMQSVLSDVNYEQFWILLLNNSNKILKKENISQGGLTSTIVDPKKIYKKALENNAASIILCHNHPSGNVKPSDADIKLTKKLRDAGKLLDLPILDHIIIGIENYFSFADEGIL